MTLSKACAVCASGDLSNFIVAHDYPAYLVPLPKDLASEVLREDLTILACATCGHMQAAEPTAATQKAIYETYYSHYQVDSAEALLPHYRAPFRRFVDRLLGAEAHLKDRRSLLEIGCSSGANIAFFTQYAERYVGIDASERIKFAKDAYPTQEFLAGYFPETMPGGQFDLIVSQFNLEHIKDISGFLSACNDKAAADGRLILQVPDIDDFERSGQPNFLAHEHLQYFRKAQLERALTRNGWTAIAWGEAGASLICAARKSLRPGMPPVTVAESPLQSLHGFATRFNTAPVIPDQPCILYGVGPQLFWLLQHIEAKQIRHILDDNPAYAGQFVPGTSWPVEVLSAAMLAQTPHVVLSLNSIYHERVLARIRAFGVPATVTQCRQGEWETIRV